MLGSKLKGVPDTTARAVCAVASPKAGEVARLAAMSAPSNPRSSARPGARLARISNVFGNALRAERSPALYRPRSAWFACTVL
jgi:hypothetical protein